jgi:beta-N-acetylhexosaminidase
MAGVDVVLGPEDIEPAFKGVLEALRGGRISVERLNTSVRKVLDAKAWVGLHRNRFVEPDSIRNVVASPAHLRIADRIADASLTLLEHDGTILPVRSGTPLRVVTVTEIPGTDQGDELALTLEQSGFQVDHVRVHVETGSERLRDVSGRLDSPGVTVIGLYLSIGAWKGELKLPGMLEEFVQNAATRPRVVVVAFGDPYVLARIPPSAAVVAAYSGGGPSERAVARAITGKIEWRGKLPVTIPGRYARGSGLTGVGPGAPRRTPRGR